MWINPPVIWVPVLGLTASVRKCFEENFVMNESKTSVMLMAGILVCLENVSMVFTVTGKSQKHYLYFSNVSSVY